MADQTYAQRLLLPRTLSPHRALHVVEAEDDLAMLAAGLDLLVAQSLPVLLTVPGSLVTGGALGAPVVLAPGNPGQMLVLGADNLITWVDIPKELPAHTAADNGKLVGLVDGAVVWMNPVTGIPDFAVADEGKHLGISNGKVAWMAVPSVLPAYSVSDSGRALVVNPSGDLEWGNSLPSAAGAATGAVLSVLSGNKVGWTTISSLLPDIPSVLKGQVLTLIAGGGMAWATIPLQLPDYSTAVDNSMLQVVGGELIWATQDMSDYVVNPMTAAYDLLIGGPSGNPDRLPLGAANQVLRVSASGTSAGWRTVLELPAYGAINNGQILEIVAGVPSWQNPVTYMSNPMTDPSDLIIGGPSGIPTRLGVGSTGQLLAVLSGGVVGWEDASFMSNPFTALGDLLYSGASAIPVRLGIGAEGQTLTVTDGLPKWVTPQIPKSVPDYTDLDGQILRVNSGVLAWVAPPWMVNPMTTVNDMIMGGIGGAPVRVPVGTSGQVWTVTSGGQPGWQDPAAAGANVPDMITVTTHAQTVPVGGTVFWYEDIPGGYNRLYGVSVVPTSALGAGTDAVLRMYGDESADLTFNTQVYSAEFTLNLQSDTGQAWYYRDRKKTGRLRLSLTNNGPTALTMAFTIVVEPF